MNLSPKYIAFFTFAVIAMFGWNAFLIVRDNKMFNDERSMNYLQNRYSSVIGETPKERFCKQQAHWHPDCNVE